MADPADDPAEDEAVAAVRRAYLEAAAAIKGTSDPDHAFARATALREAVDRLVGEAAQLRAQMARRIWKAEGASLSKLAARLGISKARADQLIRVSREAGERGSGGDGT